MEIKVKNIVYIEFVHHSVFVGVDCFLIDV
jgi:hypothetical protein